MDERVIPGLTDVSNVCKHIARYNIALPYCQDRSVLDLACGSGYGSFLISQVAKRVEGVDIEAKAIAYASSAFKSENLNYRIGDILETTLPQVDVIVSFETIEHIKDVERLEEKFMALLKPSGLMIFSVPLNESPGFNQFHLHTFDLTKARQLFSEMSLKREYVQKGVNFYFLDETETDKPFTYYIAIRQKS